MSSDHSASDPTSPDPDKDGSIDRSINFTDHHSPSEQGSDSLNSGTDSSDSQRSERWDGQSMAPQSRTDVAQYHIEGQIGGGVMTAVYRARDTLLDRMVALKVLLLGADETTRERFSQEARTAAMLEHPNIVRTYQVGQMPETGQSYIAMELVNGPSVAELLEWHPILDSQDAAALLEPIARALAYAHGRGVVHRDVKPSNILLQLVEDEHPLKIDISVVDDALAPLLSDFGIARALDSPDLTNEGRTIGTPAYMSPEQCAGADEIDGRADIYALGAVLYRCLVGRPPFAGSTTQILHAHVYDQLLIPRDAVLRLPSQALTVLKKSLMKDPSERYQTALEMADDLAILVSQDIQEKIANSDEEPLSSIGIVPVSGAVSPPSYVLVPARSTARASETPKDLVDEELVYSPVAVPASSRASSRARRPGSRSGVIVLSIALALLTIMMVVTLMSGVWPAMKSGDHATDSSGGVVSATPLVGGAQTTDTATPEPDSTSSENLGLGTSLPVDGSPPAATVERTPRATSTEPSPPTASAAITETPPLEVSSEFAWENAQAFYAERDWKEALTWLIAVQRTDPELEAENVARMLAESYVGLAQIEISKNQIVQAVQYLGKAVDSVDGSEPFSEMYEAVESLADVNEGQGPEDHPEFQRAIEIYATHMAEVGRYCEAVDEIQFANELIPSERLRGVMQEYKALCDQSQVDNMLTPPIGRIFFSSTENNVYNVFDVDIDGESTVPSYILGDGAQPSLSPNGKILAFYSRRSDIEGLVGVQVQPGGNTDDERVRYTRFVEDSRDGAPSWNPQGDRLAYGSTNFGDGRSRVYLTWADGTRNTVELGLGKDPAWHPVEDLLVFNGTDQTGNSPGLWTMNTDGTDRIQLTDNGNDQRPAWHPDGSAILFMSNGRDGNWELYRYDLASGQITRLTDNGAQDGLPSVSPDGQYVAFMSDREGYWKLWYVPVAGGEAKPLAEIAGTLPQWLEHSIQWIE